MKKIMIFIVFLFLTISMPVFADMERTVESVATIDSLGVGSTTIMVPTTTIKNTKSVSLKNNPLGNVGVMYKATSSGVVSVRIEALQSYQNSTDQTVVGNDATYVSWKTVDAGVSDQAWHAATLDTVIMPYGRFKLTGTGSNDATTTVQIKVGKN